VLVDVAQLLRKNKTMTATAINNFIRAQPFKPFTMHLSDGRAIPVKHHDFILLSPAGRTAHVYVSDEDFEIVDVLLVLSLTPGAENGRTKPRRRRSR